jgi:hypothetical protein
MSLRLPLRLAGVQILACIGVVVLRVIYVYGATFWQNATAINFIAVWIPAAIGIAVAFVPDKDLERHMRLRWRLTIATFFVLWSVVLWRQQVLTEQNERIQQAALLNSAVTQSNFYTGQQFDKTQGQITEVKNSVAETEKDLDSRVDQSTSTISTDLGKVGKPDPPEPAKLQFTLWKADLIDTDFPLENEDVYQQDDGTVSVDYMVRNVSASAADSIDIWVHICKKCSYAKEPDGFEKPAGIDDQSRHRNIGLLNPGVSYQKSTVVFKVDPEVFSSGSARVGISFSYSCKNCGNLKSTKDFVLTVISFAPGLPHITAPKLPLSQ